MNGTVDEPKRSVRAPTFSLPMVISGRRPCQWMDAITAPEALVTVVNRLSVSLASSLRGGEDFLFTNDAEGDEDDEVEGTGPVSVSVFADDGASTVRILYARSPVATSISAVLSISEAVNLYNMVAQCSSGGKR